MSKVDATSRVEFLAEQFKVFTEEELNESKESLASSKEDILIEGYNGKPLAIITTKIKKDSQYEGQSVTSFRRSISVYEDVFISMVQADPTDNKIYLQWLLTVFTKYLKDDKINEAIRFSEEDLPLAHEYLKLFDGNKRKQLFKALCKSNADLLKISDPTNINQYKNLEQVFDVIDPFIERDASTLEKALNDFVRLGEAEIPVRDRNFTLYIPKSTNASVVFNNFTNWCTASPGNGMFNSYTSRLAPDGNKSKLYAIIDNNVYNGTSEDMWQIHFESSQLRDRRDAMEHKFYDKVLSKSEALSNYFYEEMIVLARLSKEKTLENNKYLKYLLDFGHPDALFDVLDDNTPSLCYRDKVIPKLPDIGRFKSLSFIFMKGCRLKELHSSMASLPFLTQLSIPDNSIEVLPAFIGNCKNLGFINLKGNKIKHIPSEISKLDPSNGGKLNRISVSVDDIGEENYIRLKELLPNVILEDILVRS